MSTDALRLKRGALGIRDKSVGRYILYTLPDKFGEAFFITQLAEEVVTVDDDDLLS